MCMHKKSCTQKVRELKCQQREQNEKIATLYL